MKREQYQGLPCSKCGGTLRYSTGICVACRRASWNAYSNKPARQEAFRRRHLQRKFGISLEDYDAMIAEQNGGCAICGGPPESKRGRFNVDHNHETGAVRGLLCGICNQGLGQFKDDPERVLKALLYLLGRA